MKKKKVKSSKIKKQSDLEGFEEKYVPRSFVIHRGSVSANVKKLVADFKVILNPNTAQRLVAMRKNTLKDFVTMAGPLKVTHLLAFSQTEFGVILRIARLPQGPTLTFKIEDYSLAKDILKLQSKQMMNHQLVQYAPCLITNLQPSDGEPHLQMCSKMFLNMFPTISPTNIRVKTLRRCCFIHYDSAGSRFELRHYAIKTRPSDISRGTRKLLSRKVPNLAGYSDVADFFKMESGALSEAEDDAVEPVDVKEEVKGEGPAIKRQTIIKLSEIGPRINMTLIKIEEGLCQGNVLYHHFVTKTDEEKLAIRKKILEQRKLKRSRRLEQEHNVEMKKAKKEEHRRKCLDGMGLDPAAALSSKQKEQLKIEGFDPESSGSDDEQYFKEIKAKNLKQKQLNEQKRKNKTGSKKRPLSRSAAFKPKLKKRKK